MFDGPLLAERLRIPFTYCWSPALVAKPVDWGPHIGKNTSYLTQCVAEARADSSLGCA